MQPRTTTATCCKPWPHNSTTWAEISASENKYQQFFKQIACAADKFSSQWLHQYTPTAVIVNKHVSWRFRGLLFSCSAGWSGRSIFSPNHATRGEGISPLWKARGGLSFSWYRPTSYMWICMSIGYRPTQSQVLQLALNCPKLKFLCGIPHVDFFSLNENYNQYIY